MTTMAARAMKRDDSSREATKWTAGRTAEARGHTPLFAVDLGRLTPYPVSSGPTQIQRKCAGCKEEDEEKGAVLQRRASASASGAAIATSRGPLLAKLEVGSVDDPLEAEADRTAEKVLRMPDPTAGPTGEPREGTTSNGGAVLQRKCAACKGEEDEEKGVVQRRAAPGVGGGIAPAPRIVEQALSGPGRPLDAGTRAYFEPRFGVDLSRVRVHTDERAEESARAVNALAYTVGRDIVFGEGRYAPRSGEGKRLLAHELTHVVQQRTHGDNVTMRRDTPAQDHCGNIRNIAYTYRVAIEEKRFADANAIIANATLEDARYLRCRLASPADELAKFAKAQVSKEDLTNAVGKLDAKIAPPPAATSAQPAATPPADPLVEATTIQERPDYIENAVGSVGFIYGYDVFLTTRDSRVISFPLNKVFSPVAGDVPIRLALSPSEEEAMRAVKDSGIPSAVGYYRDPQSGLIFPTAITSGTAPQLSRLITYKAQWEGIARTSHMAIGVFQVADGAIGFNQLNQAVLAKILERSGRFSSGLSGLASTHMVDPPPPPPSFPRLNVDEPLQPPILASPPSNVVTFPTRTQPWATQAFAGNGALDLRLQNNPVLLPTPGPAPAIQPSMLLTPAANANAFAPGAPSFFFVPRSGSPMPLSFSGLAPTLTPTMPLGVDPNLGDPTIAGVRDQRRRGMQQPQATLEDPQADPEEQKTRKPQTCDQAYPSVLKCSNLADYTFDTSESALKSAIDGLRPDQRKPPFTSNGVREASELRGAYHETFWSADRRTKITIGSVRDCCVEVDGSPVLRPVKLFSVHNVGEYNRPQ